MDPISQILAQQNSGSAGGQGFGEFYAEGRRLNLSQQRLNLEKRKLQMDEQRHDMLLPLERQLMENQAVTQGLELGAIVTYSDIKTELNSAIPKVNSLMLKFMRSKNGFTDEALLSEYDTLYNRYPWAFSAGWGLAIKQGIMAPQMNRSQMMQMFEVQDQLQKRGKNLSSFNLKTGQVALESEPAEKTTTDITNQQHADKLRAEIGQLPEGSPERVARENTLREFLGKIAPRGNIIETPDGTRIVQGAPMNDLTTATKGKFQQDLVSADVALRELAGVSQIIQSMPDAFGGLGIVKEFGEALAGLVNPKSSADITNARNKAGLAFFSIAESLKLDSQMSEYERAQLENIGDTRGWRDKPEAAAGKVDNIRNLLIGKSLRILKAEGRQPDNFLLQQIPESELPSLLVDGLLIPDWARKWHALQRK